MSRLLKAIVAVIVTALVATGLTGTAVGANPRTGPAVASAAEPPASFAAQSAPTPPTARQYLRWLRNEGPPGWRVTARRFRALEGAKKRAFLAYLVDRRVLEALADPRRSGRSKLFGGDVVISRRSGQAVPAGDASAGDWHCWDHVEQRILGVLVTRLSLHQWYQSDTTQVTELYSAMAAKRSFNIAVDVTHSSEKQWISGAGNALAYVTWEGNIVWRGFGFSIDKLHHVRCDEMGFRASYLENV